MIKPLACPRPGVFMADIKSIFNHPQKNQLDDEKLFNWKRPFHSKNDADYLNSLLKQKKQKRELHNKSEHFGSQKPLFPANKNQRVVFKMSYGKSSATHSRYIKLYMPQIGKEGVEEKQELFGCDFEDYKKHMVPLHFKCIISPESQDIDLQLLGKTFIKHLEHLTGYEFYWLGAVHTDTDHHHLHIAINGKDKNGRKVRFPKDMIKSTIRECLSNIATSMIGERSQKEIDLSKKSIITAKRWTTLDTQLKNMESPIYIKALQPSLANRLQFLSSIGLAKHEDYYYTLSSDYENVLRTTGRYNLFLEEYLKSDLPLKLFEGGSIVGKVDKVVSFDKDESWNDAIIIRTEKERIYIPIYQLHKENLVGKTVSIKNANGGTNRNISDKDIHFVNNENHDWSIER